MVGSHLKVLNGYSASFEGDDDEGSGSSRTSLVCSRRGASRER
jgi:hypothetical protein